MDKNSSEKKSKWKVFLDTLQALDDDTLTTIEVIIVVIIILIIGKFISVDSTDSIVLNFIIRFIYAAILLLLGGCAIAAVIFVGLKITEATVDMIETYKSVKSKNEIMEEAEKNNTIMAPVACKILKAYVTAGSEIKKGQVLFIIEQSKMEMELVSPVDGTILTVSATDGQTVSKKAVLATYLKEEEYKLLPGIYDIIGESKDEYVEGLSAIMEFSIIEKDDKHIRIELSEKNYVSYTIEEQQKLLSDYIALLNNEQISSFNIRPVVQWEKKVSDVK